MYHPDTEEETQMARRKSTIKLMWMPEMDGLEATRQICACWPVGELQRIIAMTASAMQGDREMCPAAGMDDHVSKPIRVDELVAALGRSQARTQEV
jgi:CheY-like chemotaxis protein